MTPKESMKMFCYWKAENTEAVNDQLAAMNDFFEPHQFQEVEGEVFDYNS